ncbi:CopG family transcriptional regulator [Streptomyces sp. 8K308]|uniref:CopG family transcriptional regulator n=1 Tax=Streptomyces sp. 8K308 TaxID=2530388 RepID=UPI001048BA72|nr:CopG family transcriptional regulator [Streptomyces sp. 8K308]TDC27596.1 CopG family transcriptional regulator [Streptomyces sp. 8K308]
MSEHFGKYSITMPREIAEEARERSGSAGLSAYIAAAVARQIERDRLQEIIEAAEVEQGPITDEEIQEVEDTWLRAREQQRVASEESSGQAAV